MSYYILMLLSFRISISLKIGYTRYIPQNGSLLGKIMVNQLTIKMLGYCIFRQAIVKELSPKYAHLSLKKKLHNYKSYVLK